MAKKRRPVMSDKGREAQIIASAYDLAEKQIAEGTASPSVIVHFLRLATEREKLERDLLAERARLADAKTKAIDQAKKTDEMYAAAIEAMKRYGGQQSNEEVIDEDLYGTPQSPNF